MAGIGCHTLAIGMERNTKTFTHMGARGRDLGRRQPLHRHAARLPEPGRRHLLPFRLHGDPPRRRDQHHHHLQDPLQRRRRHDRRPAARRQRAAVDDQPAGPGRGRAPHRPGERRARQVSGRHRLGARRHLPSPRRARRRAARAARVQGRLGADLRPDLRRREAPPAQARHLPRSGQARVHQRGGVRGLRRLLGAVELPQRQAGRDRVRPQARHRPVVLQQGLLLPERLLPELRHGRRRRRQEGQGRQASRPSPRPNRRCRPRPSCRRWPTSPTAC